MAKIVRALWLAAERALFSCNDRSFLGFTALSSCERRREPWRTQADVENYFRCFYRSPFKEAQNSNISVRSLGSNAPFSAGNHAITRGFVR